jgi:hypothetical protein
LKFHSAKYARKSQSQRGSDSTLHCTTCISGSIPVHGPDYRICRATQLSQGSNTKEVSK